MIDPIAHILAYPDLSSEEMAALRRAIAADPTIAALFACRAEIARSIRIDGSGEDVTANDRRLFALFSLYRAGRAHDLTPGEVELVARHADRLEAMLEDHPGLAVASEDVADAAAEFSELWDAHFEIDGAPATSDRAAAEDRAPAERAPIDGAPVDEPARIGGAPAENPATRRSAAERRSGTSRHAGAPPRRRRNAYRWAVRTAIALSVVAFAFVLTQVIERDADMLTVETADGETRLIEIGEGSRIRLMESSTLAYSNPQSSLIRRARRYGRAYFEIAREESGFIVETANARVTVLGTTFTVEAPDGLTEVVLAEGRLTLARGERLDDLVVLESGQMSRIVAGAGPTAPVAVDVSRMLTWTGLFIFQSTPLAEIASLLSDHFAVAIEVDDSLAEERVTGTFEQDQALREILGIIAAAVDATVRPDGEGGYVLTHP